MLIKLSKFKSLGTNNYFREFFYLFKNNNRTITETQYEDLFHNKLIDYILNINGPKQALIALEVIKSTGKELSIVKYKDENDFLDEIKRKLLTFLIDLIENDKFILKSSIHYDDSKDSFYVNNSSIKLVYSNIKHLLVEFKILNFKNNRYYFSGYNKQISKLLQNFKIDLDKRIQDLIRKTELGEQAEYYVIEFEKNRIGTDELNIQKVSSFDDSAGYDLLSYESKNSKEYDRYIEVKSYSSNCEFYFSRNEYTKSKSLGDKYYLYLVDRTKMHGKELYSPIIIKNPYKEIFENNSYDSIVIPQSYHIKL